MENGAPVANFDRGWHKHIQSATGVAVFSLGGEEQHRHRFTKAVWTAKP
jgi:hypothetical protein